MFSLNSDFSSDDTIDLATRTIKTTRLEGMAFEFMFKEAFATRMRRGGYEHVDALVLKERMSRGTTRYLIHPRSYNDHLPRALASYINQHVRWPTVHMLEEHESELYHWLISDDSGQLDVLEPRAFEPASQSVIDTSRAQRFLSQLLPDKREDIASAIRNIVIKDCFFRKYLTDFDHFFRDEDNNFVYLETKHKYPTSFHEFGLNKSELKSMGNLQSIGMDVWHVILVKPYWNRHTGSHVLLEDKDIYDRALWIAAPYRRLVGHSVSKGAAHTSLKGSGQTTFHRISCDNFNVLGTNAEAPETLCGRFLYLLGGGVSRRVSPDLLDSLRVA